MKQGICVVMNWFRKLEKLTIRHRLLAASLFLVIVTNTTTLGFFYWYSQAYMESTITDKTKILLGLVAQYTASALKPVDGAVSGEHMGALMAHPALMYTIITDSKNQVIYHYDPFHAHSTRSLATTLPATTDWYGISIQEWQMPLNHAGTSTGNLVIGLDDSLYYDQKTRATRLALCLFALVITQTMVFARWLQRLILEEVIFLDSKAHAYIQDPASWKNLPEDQADELGRLCATFNTLAKRIGEREQEILAINAGLEKQVLDRTRDLVRTREQALIASQAKSDFLANMSHEIRTPLTAISGYSFLLSKTILDYSQREYLTRIEIATHSLLSIIQDLLDFSKIESGNIELYKTHFSLRDICTKAVAQAESEALKKDIGILLEISDAVPDTYEGDAIRLGQVLINLTSNAVKFTHRGKVMLMVEVESIKEDTVHLRFSVRDTGIGLQPDQIDKLFKPFTQADASITRQYGGTGLGLAICQRLVKLMQGEIGLHSVAGIGSTFFFTIPLRCIPTPSDATQAVSPCPLSAPATVTPTPMLTGLRLLVVEDNEVNQMLLCEWLEMEGATVDVAVNGPDALTRIRNPGKIFDAVLMDVQMPGMDGIETTRHIRQHPNGVRLPIIAMTAHTRDQDREACLAAGMNDYSEKPINMEKLTRTLIYWVNQSALAREYDPSPRPDSLADDPESRWPSVTTASNEEHPDSLDHLLKQLSHALAHSDLDAERLWQQLRRIMASQPNNDPLLDEVDAAIKKLEFLRALRTLNRWKHEKR